jgi:uncharacterized RDD family membrane protein YckC
MENLKSSAAQCTRCGQPLRKDAPEGLCAACLFAAAARPLTAGSTDDIPTMSFAPMDSSTPTSDGPRLVEGQTWGPYRIVKLLGRGGMGEVYESEHTVSGRRIALKVLRERLQNADQRARFLREGQLAASISHPHTVYIFGSEEISGTPVISMELLPGGTLKDLVTDRGPLPPAEAVSAILDIIGGLDAAQAAGVLHRDIKPSNCFLDNEGSVKVGDFGLSISTLARDVRHELTNSGFEGTPQFAPPEQLRGEPLDVRADIYAVGATLYYLLTGQTPFDAHDLRELVQRVTTDPPKSPRRIRPQISSGLAAIVLRCLAKEASGRPASYAELAESLRPFSSTDFVPAQPGLRCLAGVVDGMLIPTVVTLWTISTGDLFTETYKVAPWLWAIDFAYYLVLEGFWGASIGKRLFGLRVTTMNGTSSGWLKILYRTSIYYLPSVLMTVLPMVHLFPNISPSDPVRSVLGIVLVVAMFSTARLHNGWAGLHDLISRTRVTARVSRTTRRSRAILDSPGAAAFLPAVVGKRFGPFIAVSDVGKVAAGPVVIAFDPVLRRRIWIHEVALETPPIASERRDVGRAGRLFWLTGRRSVSENWDAFEAPDGEAFLNRKGELTDWPTLKAWLMDLANELGASVKDGSTPKLALDHVWIRSDGRLVLLDFPAPGTESPSSVVLSPVGLLSAVASSVSVARTSAAEPRAMPLSARVMLDRWVNAPSTDLNAVGRELADAASRPDHVSRWRRALPIAFAAAPSLFLLAVALLILPSLYLFLRQNGGMLSMLEALHQTNPPFASRLPDPEVRDAYEIYLVGTYAAELDSDKFWSSPIMKTLQDRRAIARQALQHHPSVSADELAHARVLIAPAIERAQRDGVIPIRDLFDPVIVMIETLVALSLLLAVLCCLTSSVSVPGGTVMRVLGLAVVTSDGTEITRLRSLVRAILAWLPAILWLAFLMTSPKIQGWVPAPQSHTPTVVLLGILMFGAIWSIVRPRGLHDRISGTWIVPR